MSQDNLTSKQNDYTVFLPATMITVDSGLAVYNYILPAQSK
jgi:hypothetical protein